MGCRAHGRRRECRDSDVYEDLQPLLAPLVAYGARYCNLTAQDAKDLAQDLFTQIWTTRRSWTVHSSAFRYLLRAMENRALNRHRAEHRRAGREQAVMSTIEAAVVNDAEYAIEQRELSAVVSEILDGMPPREYEVLRMRKWEGRSMREIEETLSLSPNTVRAALSSAMARLHCEWHVRGWDLTLPIRQYEGRQNTRTNGTAGAAGGGSRHPDATSDDSQHPQE
jgi:RNA polymerase sigma factor (sigma-70 family)